MAIRPSLHIYARTTAPQWIFRDSSTPINYSNQAIDAGLIQTDSLHMNLEETLAACRAIYANSQQLIDQELAFIKANEIDLVVIGSHGCSGIMSLLLGSTASKLLDWLPCDMLLVPDPCARA